MAACDAWLAVNLPRADDVVLANAWLDGRDLSAVANEPAAPLVARAAELGLAVSRLGETDDPAPWPVPDLVPPAAPDRAGETPLVVDLSALWAGPLCANLLGLAGARVVKVESPARPDGARAGAPAFFDLLHHGHASVALAFDTQRGRDALRALVAAADVVIEASRPRAMQQLGIDAAAEAHRGAVWVSITAYGRAQPMRIGFGDDVAIAAGVHAGPSERPFFCADAIADPITGLYAAVAALSALREGRGALLDISMAGVARLARGDCRAPERVGDAAPPRARARLGPARPLGADTAEIMAEIGVRRWD